MSYPWLERSADRLRVPSIPLDERDGPWLGLALLAGLLVSALYLALNEYPAYGAGLYTATADQIRASGYGLPPTIPGYTAEGVPFAYPPLAFYALAVLRDLGADPFAAARVVPPVVVVAAVVPAYLVGRDLLGGRVRGSAAALLVLLDPQVLEWHVSAGGLVRAPAFFLALAGAYAGLRVFRDRESAWVPVGLVLFALVVLTHPTYALFVVVTDVVFWLGYDRTVRGLARGAVLGVGGVLLAAPWWLSVAARHGFEVFAGAAGTHGGVGGGLLAALGGPSVWSLGFLAAGVITFLGGWRTLPAWLVAAEALFEQPRFSYAVGAFALVAAAVVVADAVADRSPHFTERRGRLALAGVLLIAAAGLGVVAYEFGGLTDQTTPAFVDDDDAAAMAWVERETEPGATFVVLGDAAEWFPALTDRTILVSPWGAEWRGPETYERHLHAYTNVSACQSVGCVERQAARVGATPDYLYVPKGGYTVRGDRAANFGSLERSTAVREGYELVYESEGVAIYRVERDPNRPASFYRTHAPGGPERPRTG